MKKIDNFIKSFKKPKKIKPQAYKSGQKVILYKTDYTVMSCNDRYTLLKDMKGTPVAYPTDKLTNMLKKSRELDRMSKAGQMPPRNRGGMIRVDKVDKHGRKYHYFVHAKTGKKHIEQSSESAPHENQIDEQSKKHYMDMRSIINQHAHPADQQKLHELLDNFVESKAAHHHLSQAYKQISQDDSEHFDLGMVQKLGDKKDDYERSLNKLINEIKVSKKKRL